MKIKTSDKEYQNFEKVLIPKGYYPVQLTSVKAYQDKDGKDIISEYKNQKFKNLILDFTVWLKDQKTGAPLSEMQHQYSNNKTENIVLSYFVTYQRLEKDENTGKEEWVSNMTEKSKMAKVFSMLGYSFKKDTEFDTDDYLGRFVEANISDHEKEEDGKKVKFSVIKELEFFEGPEPLAPTKKEEQKEVKTPVDDSKEPEYSDPEEAKRLLENKANLQNLLNDKTLSQEGYDKSVESIDARLEALRK